jgi:hypothetical protein
VQRTGDECCFLLLGGRLEDFVRGSSVGILSCAPFGRTCAVMIGCGCCGFRWGGGWFGIWKGVGGKFASRSFERYTSETRGFNFGFGGVGVSGLKVC